MGSLISQPPLLLEKRDNKSIIFQLLSNTDSLLILVLSFLFLFFMVTFDLWLPMMVIDTLGWKVLELNIIVLGSSVLSGIFFAILSFKTLTPKGLHILMLISIISMMLVQPIFYLIDYWHNNLNIIVPLWIFWAILFIIVCMPEEIYLITTFSKMVASSKQTYAESVRLGFARGGELSALLCSVYLFEWLSIFSLIAVAICLIITIIFLIRGKRLRDPKRIIH